MLTKVCRELYWCFILQFSAFLLFSCNHSEKKIVARFADGRPQVVYEFPDSNDTLTYTLKILGPSGNLKQMAFVSHGMFVNKAVTYMDNGVPYRIDSLLAPCKSLKSCDEIRFIYNENGTPSQIYTVMNGVCEGNIKQYSQNGTLIKSYNLIHDSVKNGEYLEFFNSGKIAFRAEYKNDTMVGIGYVFKENGDSSRWFRFFKGHNDLPTKVWLDNGNTQIGDYLDDKKHAVIWKWHDKEGHEIRKQIEYAKHGSFVRPN